MIHESFFSNLIMRLAVIFRKIYAPILYWVLYPFVFRRYIKDHKDILLNKHKGFPDGTLGDFMQTMTQCKRKWKSDKWGGVLDITLLDPVLFLSEDITDSWGRDCDDFAHWWYHRFTTRGYDEVYKILLTTWKNGHRISKSHYIVVARNISEKDFFTIFDNGNIRYVPSRMKTLDDTLQWYAEWRAAVGKDYENMVWTFHNKFVNK